MSIESSSYSDGIRTTKYDNTKLCIFNNSFATGDVNADSYDDLVLPIGTVMGRVSATGELVALASGASDGSQYPVGVLAANYTIEAGDTKEVSIVTGGEIDASLLAFDGSDDLDTVISGKQLRDRLASDTVGLVLRNVDELSEFDND